MSKIIFFGSSTFSVVVLRQLVLGNRCSVLGIVTNEDKPVGRHLVMTPNPVKVLAKKLNIPVYDNIHDFLKADFPGCIGIIAAYGKIIGPKTLAKLDNQIYGIHPSLLPKYRGPSPLQQQILDGVIDTGVTIFKIDLDEDTGPIVTQIYDKILPTDTTITLGNRLFEIGANWFIENYSKIENYELKIQDESLATHTHKFTKQDGFLELGILDLGFERKRRAFAPWPGVWTIKPNGDRLKL